MHLQQQLLDWPQLLACQLVYLHGHSRGIAIPPGSLTCLARCVKLNACRHVHATSNATFNMLTIATSSCPRKQRPNLGLIYQHSSLLCSLAFVQKQGRPYLLCTCPRCRKLKSIGSSQHISHTLSDSRWAESAGQYGGMQTGPRQLPVQKVH